MLHHVYSNTFIYTYYPSMIKAKINFSNKTYQQHDIKFIKIIGQGNWSDVYLARNLDNTEKYAVKVIAQAILTQTPKIKQLVQAEKNILKNCNHPNIVIYFKDFNEDAHQFIVLEYCNGGDLGDLLSRENTIPEHQAIKFMFQILNGFKGLHKVNAMHRDFKVQNVMLHNDCCKIVDLGFGKQLASLDSVTQTKLGSHLTMAPEVMKKQPYGIKADIWSIGVVFYQLLQGNYPFTGRNIDKILQKIQKNQILFSRGESSEAMDFIRRCLVVDEQKRMGWKQIYQHALFNKLSSNKIINNSMLLTDAKEQNRQYYAENEESRISVKPIYKLLDSNKSSQLCYSQSDLSIRQVAKSKKGEIEQDKMQIRIEWSRPKQLQIQKEEINQALRDIRRNSIKEQSKIQLQSQIEQIDTLNHKESYSPSYYRWKIKQNKMQSEQPLEEQEFFRIRLQTAIRQYTQMQRNCCYVAEILHDRYRSIKVDLPDVNHQAYMAILWKDSYMKLAELIQSLQTQRNIFYHETIDLFFTKHRQDFIAAYRGLLDQAKIQFYQMVGMAKNKEIWHFNIFKSEAQNIGQKGKQNKRPWARYIKDIIEQYCCQMVQAAKVRQKKLLFYCFCLLQLSQQSIRSISTNNISRIISSNSIDQQKVHKQLDYIVVNRGNTRAYLKSQHNYDRKQAQQPTRSAKRQGLFLTRQQSQSTSQF